MYIIKKIALVVLTIIFLAGCAEIQPFEAPTKVLKHPLGTDPIRLGMAKDEVRDVWGAPDRINKLGFADQWGTPQEEWIYKGRYSNIPIDKGYFSKTKYLYFEADVLTSFGDKAKKQPQTQE